MLAIEQISGFSVAVRVCSVSLQILKCRSCQLNLMHRYVFNTTGEHICVGFNDLIFSLAIFGEF